MLLMFSGSCLLFTYKRRQPLYHFYLLIYFTFLLYIFYLFTSTGDDATGVKWTDINRHLKLFASHSEFIKKVAVMHNAHWQKVCKQFNITSRPAPSVASVILQPFCTITQFYKTTILLTCCFIQPQAFLLQYAVLYHEAVCCTCLHSRFRHLQFFQNPPIFLSISILFTLIVIPFYIITCFVQ